MWNFFEFKCVLEGNEELLVESGLVRRPKAEPLGQSQQTTNVTPSPERPARRAAVVRQAKPEFRASSRHGEDVGKFHTNTQNPLMGQAISKQIVDKGAHLDPKMERGASKALDDVIRDNPKYAKPLQAIAKMIASGSFHTSLGNIIDTLNLGGSQGASGGGAGGGGGGGGGGLGGGLGGGSGAGLSSGGSQMAQALMLLRDLNMVDFVDAKGNSLPKGQPPNADTVIVPADSVYQGEKPDDVADMASQRAAGEESRKGYGLTGSHQHQQAIRQRDIEQAKHPEQMTGPSEGMSRQAMASVKQMVGELVRIKSAIGLDSDAGQKSAREAYEKLKGLWGQPLNDEAKKVIKGLAEKLVKIIKPAHDKQEKKMHKEWLEFYSLMEQYGV